MPADVEPAFEGFRLSPLQQRRLDLSAQGIWLPLGGIWQLEGDLDLAALRRAVETCVARYEILRARFVSVPGAHYPLQRVDRVAPHFVVVDLSRLENEVGRGMAERHSAAAATRRILPDALSPLQVALSRLSKERHLLTVALDPLCGDSATLTLWQEEIASLYGAGEPSAEVEIFQYPDIAAWQHEALELEDGASGRAYWQGRKGTETSPLELFGVWSEASVQQEPARAVRLVDHGLAKRFAALGEPQGTPVETLWLAAWGAFLGVVGARRSLVLGVSFDGRNYEELERAPGLLERILPFSIETDGDESWTEFLARVERSRRESEEWQEFFSWAGQRAGSPWAATFRYGQSPVASEGGGVRFTPVRLDAQPEPSPLALTVLKEGESFRLELSASLPRSRSLEVAGWLNRLITWIEGIAVAPQLAIFDLDLLSAVELEAVGTEAPSVERSAYENFATQARRTPHAPALTQGGRRLSYLEALGWVDGWAGELLRRGVQPEEPVALLLERAPEMLLAQLAAWRAGAAFVVLDPTYPQGRLAQIAEAAGVRRVLAGNRLRHLADSLGVEVIALDAGVRWVDDARAVWGSAELDALAYVVFTSGTTGRPKGILATHRGVSGYLDYLVETYGLGPGDRVLQLAAPAFDSALRDGIAPLTCGAEVILLDSDAARDPNSIFEAIARLRPTMILSIVPTLLREVLRAAEGREEHPTELRLVLVSGESLDGAICAAVWRTLGAQVRLVNQYGPSECTMTSTWFEVSPDSPLPEVVPIGVPIAGASLRTVNPRGRGLPPGVVGELWIGGAHLARGYLGAPDLTAESFRPDSFSGFGARIYRTGDLGRIRLDGVAEFRGRVDQQVKLRGLRIEPAEIESALRRFPGVVAAVVGLRGEPPLGPNLVAWIAWGSGEKLPIAELRTTLGRELPEFMIPSQFIRLSSLPMLPNGKVDRSSLPNPDDEEAPMAFTAPRTSEEEIVAAIWADVLGRERVGAHDNFFQLGGHSLLATRVISRLGEAFGVALPLQTIFDRPTVAELCLATGELRRKDRGDSGSPIGRVAPGARIPLSLSQLRIWFLEQLRPGGSGWIIPTGLQLTGQLDYDALAKSLREIVRRHESLRTRFVAPIGDEEPSQRVDPQAELEVPLVELSNLPSDDRIVEARRLLGQEALRPFDLSRAPLLRTRVLRLAADVHWVVASLHHIVGDGWSTGVLARELIALYGAFSCGAPSPLADLPVQYGDYADWQRRWLDGEALARLIAYWRDRLAPPLDPLPLPTDRPRGSSSEFRGGRIYFTIESERAVPLRDLARRLGATAFMLLLSAFRALLFRLSGATDTRVGALYANRNRIETEPLIGDLANIVVLRIDLTGAPPFRELLARERHVALESFDRADLPFAKLMEMLQQDGTIGREAPFQTMFSLQNFSVPAAEGLAVEVERLAFEREERAERELALGIKEAGESFLGSFSFNADLFDSESVERWARHFRAMLDCVAAEPDRRISEIEIFTPAERRQLESEWPFGVFGSKTPDPRLAAAAAALGCAPETTAGVFVLDSALFPAAVGVWGRVHVAVTGQGPKAFKHSSLGWLASTDLDARWRPDGFLDLAPLPGAPSSTDIVLPAGAKASAGDLEARRHEVAERGARLSSTKRDLLEKLLGESSRSDSLVAVDRIEPRKGSGPAPLSFAQERLWFLSRMDASDPAYNVPFRLHLEGNLRIGALKLALLRVCERHELLHSRIGMVAERPMQFSEPPVVPVFSQIDLQGLGEADRNKTERRILSIESRRPFDLSSGFVRGGLVRIAARDYLLFGALHHIASDAASSAIFARELLTYYDEILGGSQVRLPALPIQYGDFAAWQRERLAGDRVAAEIAFWRKRLEGAPGLLALPWDRPRPAVQTSRGGRRGFELAAADPEMLTALGRGESATLFVVLLAAFFVLLERSTLTEDLSVGTPMSGRDRVETEPLIGLFINTLVIRADLSGGPSFREILSRVRSRAVEAQSHQSLPFEMLVAELAPERSLSHSPLFQVMFSFETAGGEGEGLKVPGLTVHRLISDTATAKFDLTLSLSRRKDGLVGAFEFNTDLFDPASILRLARRYSTLLRAVALRPDRRLDELGLFDVAERHQLEREWNDTRRPTAAYRRLHAGFAAWSERTPDATAVVCGEHHATYGEIARRAERLADALRGAGIGSGDVVGIPGDRILATSISILAVLESGAAVLTLDPDYPQERFAFMVEDSMAWWLPGERKIESPAPTARTITAALEAAGKSPRPPRLTDDDEDLAYVIYTSGSTGRPKGIAMAHAALSNLIRWQLASRPMVAGTRTLQFAPLSFDVAFQEMFATWSSGGVLVLVPREVRRDPRAVIDLVEHEEVERLYLPYVALQQLAEVASDRPFATLALAEVFTAGEQLRVTPQISALFERLPRTRLHNQYGPAETHVVTEETLAGTPDGWPELPAIGRPIDGSRIAVVDRFSNLVAMGVMGELCIAGDGLARGYLGRPDLTAARFVPDPLGEGGRLYRTGDLARFRPEGKLEYLGRLDHQVKIRGFRIEPGEVESILAQFPAIGDVAVVARRYAGGDVRLIAALVKTGQDEPPSAAQLRAWLAGRVPDYMIPAQFVWLDVLPLTPSGKADRAALAKLGAESQPTAERVAPRTPTESRIAEIWGQVLDLPDLSVEADFFSLGGHSLLATRVISRIHAAFGVELSLRRLFEAPTIAGLAQIVDGLRPAESGDLERIDEALRRVSNLSDAEVQALLEMSVGGEG